MASKSAVNEQKVHVAGFVPLQVTLVPQTCQKRDEEPFISVELTNFLRIYYDLSRRLGRWGLPRWWLGKEVQ